LSIDIDNNKIDEKVTTNRKEAVWYKQKTSLKYLQNLPYFKKIVFFAQKDSSN
jgi:hypothetical protein